MGCLGNLNMKWNSFRVPVFDSCTKCTDKPGPYVDILSMDVSKASRCQAFGRLVQKLSVFTVRFAKLGYVGMF